MIRDIDNNRPSKEDYAEIIKTPCIKCGELYNSRINVTYVRTSNGRLIWWHGLVLTGDSEFKPYCKPKEEEKHPPKRHKMPVVKSKCPTCGKVYTKSKYEPYCQKSCVYVTTPERFNIKKFLEE